MIAILNPDEVVDVSGLLNPSTRPRQDELTYPLVQILYAVFDVCIYFEGMFVG